MKLIGVDTNVLVYAHVPAFPQHREARAYMLRLLAKADVQVVLTPLVLIEFIHVITDAKRFEPPVSVEEATAVAKIYLDRPNVRCGDTTQDDLALALKWMDQHHLGRRRLADTLFAACLVRLGVRKLATYNAQDFALFSQLRTVEPAV